ncbi:MAG TPA: hypothetical protein VEM32_06630 [Geobacteraceae bacterium]|nr:hypothetical protein [Geobacteraceae bacterium]
MSRYRTQFLSATAIAVDTAFGFLMCPASGGYNLRRITGGLVTVGSSGAPPDQDCLLGIAAATAGPTGAPTTTTTTLLNQNSVPSLMIAATTYATTNPTFSASAADPFQIPVSSRGGYDLLWEAQEEWQILKGVANGLVFVNRQNALTTPLAWKLLIEWEE